MTNELVSNMVCNYVRSFSDTWSYLMRKSSTADIKNKRKAKMAAAANGHGHENTTTTTSLQVDLEEDIREWNKNKPLCNPLFGMKDRIERDTINSKVRVIFSVETDDRSGVSQTAVLMLALDSFISLLGSADCSMVISDKDKNTFNIRVPFNARAESLLNNAGFPAGLCGPFKRWSINFKASGLSGKSGIAGLSGSVLTDINNGVIGTKGTTILEMANLVSNSVQQLDDSEMSRTLSYAKRLGADNSFSVCTSRQVNQHNIFRQQNAFVKNLADRLSAAEGAGAVAPAHFKEEEPATDDKEAANDEEDLLMDGVNKNFKKTQTKKRSRRKGECSINTLSFVEKYVGNCKALSVKSSGCPPPSKEFTSLFMSGAEADACYQTCRSMRGASRIRSLLNKYGNKELMKEKKDGSGWKWTSPKDRRVILVDEHTGGEFDLVFEVHCNKSQWFDVVSSIPVIAKPWVRDTSKLIHILKCLEEFLPSMGSAMPHIVMNLMKTLAGVCSLRDTIGFRIPEHGKNLLPITWTAPMSSMGITSQRYDRIIEVMDLLITGGAFVTSCLNNIYFYENGIEPKKTWLHVDVMDLSARVFECVNSRIDKYGAMGSCAPILISKTGISIKNIDSPAKLTQLPSPSQHQPTRQSIDMAISSIINNYTEVSSKYRERAMQKCMTDHGKHCLDAMIYKEGALRALTKCTVKGVISRTTPAAAEGNGSFDCDKTTTSNAAGDAVYHLPVGNAGVKITNKPPIVKIESYYDGDDADDNEINSLKSLNNKKRKNKFNKLKKLKKLKNETTESEESRVGEDSTLLQSDDDDSWDGQVDVLRLRKERIRKFVAITALSLTHQSLGNAITQKSKGSKEGNVFNLQRQNQR